jgi:hypothetical protein
MQRRGDRIPVAALVLRGARVASARAHRAHLAGGTRLNEFDRYADVWQLEALRRGAAVAERIGSALLEHLADLDAEVIAETLARADHDPLPGIDVPSTRRLDHYKSALDLELSRACHDRDRRMGERPPLRLVGQRGSRRPAFPLVVVAAASAEDVRLVAHVAGGEQSERVRRHLTNCPACAHTARELERVARGVGALLPLPPTVDPEVVHRFGAIGRALGRLLPFSDSGEGAVAAKAGAAAAAGGTGAVTAGSSVVGLGAAKLGVTALCVAGAAGGYVVCDQIGLFSGPLPRERHHVATTATVRHRSPTRRAPSAAIIRAPAPIAHTIRQAPATAAPSAQQRATSSTAPSGQAGAEFGFEGDGGKQDSAPASSSSSSPSARAASAGGKSTGPTAPARGKPSAGSGACRASAEFGFE